MFPIVFEFGQFRNEQHSVATYYMTRYEWVHMPLEFDILKITHFFNKAVSNYLECPFALFLKKEINSTKSGGSLHKQLETTNHSTHDMLWRFDQ